MKKQIIVILDFGSQYTNLIRSSLYNSGTDSVIIPGDEKLKNFQKSHKEYEMKGIIFSGGSSSVYDGNIDFDLSWIKDTKVPILGICYGHQLIAHESGGLVEKSKTEFGRVNLKVLEDDLIFTNVKKDLEVWMSHGDAVINLPPGCLIVASSDYSDIAAYRTLDGRIRALQFHPEVTHTESGEKILENFSRLVCGIEQGEVWSAKSFCEENINSIQTLVGNNKVLLALSGGVDSMTLAGLLRKSLQRESIQAVYVDTGLMSTETRQEVIDFCEQFDIQLDVLDESDVFFKALEGITDPGLKGKAIGYKFIEVFENYAKNCDAVFLAQGTIWSDVVESGVTKFSSQIKPHHNVACLPEKMELKLLEPLRNLFKNQVREIARYLGLPESVSGKKVFPGPGFAIRVQGVVTKDKVDLVRKATEIIEEIVRKADYSEAIWMCFAILIQVPSLGVKGDKHVKNKEAIVVRIVESENSMTAIFSRKVMDILPEISRRIIDETSIGRVVYDITDKPPGTIEWQ